MLSPSEIQRVDVLVGMEIPTSLVSSVVSPEVSSVVFSSLVVLPEFESDECFCVFESFKGNC